MEFTGEQFVPAATDPRIEEDHRSRYSYAESFVSNKYILDVACGSGYGSYTLAKVGANKVVGMDISDAAIGFARSHYSSPNLEYQIGNASSLPFDDRSFDVVVSFETIEHLSAADRDRYLNEIYRVLKTDGVFLLSTPNRFITSPGSKKPLNKFHIIEYSLQELSSILNKARFKITSIKGQRLVFRLLIPLIARKLVGAIQLVARRDFSLYHQATGSGVRNVSFWFQPRYIIVVAKK